MRAVALVVIFVSACGSTSLTQPRLPPPPPQPAQLSSPALSQPPSSSARALEIPLHPQTYQLPNGLTAILVPDPTADVASVLVRYNVGAIDDPAGTSWTPSRRISTRTRRTR